MSPRNVKEALLLAEAVRDQREAFRNPFLDAATPLYRPLSYEAIAALLLGLGYIMPSTRWTYNETLVAACDTGVLDRLVGFRLALQLPPCLVISDILWDGDKYSRTYHL